MICKLKHSPFQLLDRRKCFISRMRRVGNRRKQKGTVQRQKTRQKKGTLTVVKPFSEGFIRMHDLYIIRK